MLRGDDVEYILAIDPGRAKNGVALVTAAGQVVCQSVVETGRLLAHIEELLARYAVTVIVIGNRTGGRKLSEQLRSLGLGKNRTIVSVDEDYSTEEGRRLYWRENPPRGLRRLLPVTLQTPPRPIDDYVARILAARYLALKPAAGEKT